MLWSIDALLGKKKSENETKAEHLKMFKTNHTDVYWCAAYHSLLWELHIK